jgi:hypothetical protein
VAAIIAASATFMALAICTGSVDASTSAAACATARVASAVTLSLEACASAEALLTASYV